MEMIIFIGIQASGKSTFYKKYFFDSHVRINLDMLKTRNREKILINACFDSKSKFVIDNTNFDLKGRANIIEKAKKYRYTILGYYFSSNVEASIIKNKKRNNKVPDIAILSTYKKLELPSFSEGFDKLYYVKNENEDFIIEEWKDEV